MVQAYAGDVFRYALWLCGDRSRAEDLVQETYMRAWKAMGSLKDHRAAKSWLFTIVRRENARYYARKQPETTPLEDLNIDDVDLDAHAEAGSGAADDDTALIRQALAALPVEYREPLVLQVLGGYSAPEIGALLNMKPGAVLTRLFRARQKLRQLLEPSARPARGRVPS